MSTTQGDALERLLDEQRQIDELLQSHARHQRDPAFRPVEAARLSGLIVTLLRVHLELEARLLAPALAQVIGDDPALARAASQRMAVAEAIERVEALSPRDPDYALEMSALARRVRLWFAASREGLFERARESALDLTALDGELALRQEASLSAGRER
jgi:hypothetical protein